MTTNSTRSAQKDRSNMIASAYRAMYGKVYGYVAKRIGHIADVEDIVQDTFESLLRPTLLLSEQTLDRYIYSTAHNLVIDWYRRHACKIKAQEYFFAHSPLAIDNAASKVQVSDIVRLESMALSEVGEKGRVIYIMYVHEGNRVKDIAVRMGLNERTVENHIFRTKNRVRESLKKAL